MPVPTRTQPPANFATLSNVEKVIDTHRTRITSLVCPSAAGPLLQVRFHCGSRHPQSARKPLVHDGFRYCDKRLELPSEVAQCTARGVPCAVLDVPAKLSMIKHISMILPSQFRKSFYRMCRLDSIAPLMHCASATLNKLISARHGWKMRDGFANTHNWQMRDGFARARWQHVRH